MRVYETYSLDCYVCGAAVEMPANSDTCCPRCGTGLDIRWRESVPTPTREEIAQPPLEETRESAAVDNPSEAAQQQLASEALARARSRHADFDCLWPAMAKLSEVVSFDWRFIAYDDFYESLYVLARHAEFAQPARAALIEHSRIVQLSQAPPVSERLQ